MDAVIPCRTSHRILLLLFRTTKKTRTLCVGLLNLFIICLRFCTSLHRIFGFWRCFLLHLLIDWVSKLNFWFGLLDTRENKKRRRSHKIRRFNRRNSLPVFVTLPAQWWKKQTNYLLLDYNSISFLFNFFFQCVSNPCSDARQCSNSNQKFYQGLSKYRKSY